MKRFIGGILFITLLSCAPMQPHQPSSSITWNVDNLEQIGPHPVVEVVGNPEVIETDQGKAVSFDGEGDGLFLDTNPLEGLDTFTIEVIFQPYAGGSEEQRFFHMQDQNGEDRVIIETRLPGEETWFLDSFVKTAGNGHTLYAEDHVHPIGPWYHAALVVTDDRIQHYVNGKLQGKASYDYKPLNSGRTSLGVRINKVHWYKGAIRKIRFTPTPLSPEQFLSAE